jgi:hypothetical protein
MLFHKHRESSPISLLLVGNGQQLSSFLKVISSPLGPASALKATLIYRFVSCISIKDINRVVFIVTVF